VGREEKLLSSYSRSDCFTCERRRRAHIRKKLTIEIFVAVSAALLFSSFLYLLYFSRSPSSQEPAVQTLPFKAAIVDHLGITGWPNQSFVNRSTTILESAGFDVDYYSGEKVTVDFYKDLPSHGYGLIVLRVHSAWLRVEKGKEGVTLFTSEPYEEGKYADYRGLVIAYFSRDERYFGVGPGFIRALNGSFTQSIVIMMGCNGLRNPEDDMAKAFVEKGARVYISWSLEVLAGHTDTATTRLLEHLLLEKQTVKDAVGETMSEVGPDPFFNVKNGYEKNSTLLYYPEEAGSYVIQDNASSSLNVTTTSYVVEWASRRWKVLKVNFSMFPLISRTS